MQEARDLLDKAFELACFLVGDRNAAIHTLIRALHKWDVQSNAEDKRMYWRDKYLKRRINRISRPRMDVLQWLILFESDAAERDQERIATPAESEMTVRYLKHLIRLTSSMSAFYVNVAISRFIYRYPTSQAQNTYEVLTQHYIGADEYRRSKALLTAKLIERFGQSLTTVRASHGEITFAPRANSNRWSSLVEQCLCLFTPWSTKNVCRHTAFSGTGQTGRIALDLSANSWSDRNEAELYCCHVLIHPPCYQALVSDLGLDSPEKKLSLPLFHSADPTDMGNSDRPRKASPLNDDERLLISSALTSETHRRQRAARAEMRITVDGFERKIAKGSGSQGVFQIQEGEQLIEIWTRDEQGDLLLGSYVVQLDVQGILSDSASFPLGNHGRLHLSVKADHTRGPARSALVSFQYHKTAWLGQITSALPQFRSWFFLKPRYGMAWILTAILAWGVTVWVYQERLDSARKSVDQLQKELNAAKTKDRMGTTQQSPVAAWLKYRLVADENIIRGRGGSNFPNITLPADPAIIAFELPMAGTSKSEYEAVLRPFSSSRVIARQRVVPSRPTDGILVFLVPSPLLQADMDYSIELIKSGSGTLHSYSFHIVKQFH